MRGGRPNLRSRAVRRSLGARICVFVARKIKPGRCFTSFLIYCVIIVFNYLRYARAINFFARFFGCALRFLLKFFDASGRELCHTLYANGSIYACSNEIFIIYILN